MVEIINETIRFLFKGIIKYDKNQKDRKLPQKYGHNNKTAISEIEKAKYLLVCSTLMYNIKMIVNRFAKDSDRKRQKI